MKTFDIQPVRRQMQAAIQAKTDNLNKPKGSLGRLEELAMQVITSVISAFRRFF